MTTTFVPAAAAPRVREWLRLQAALSGTALIVVGLRSFQTAQLGRVAGIAMPWAPILATQAAFWIGWSLWAGALIPLMRRLVERPPSAGFLLSLIGLALVPALCVPLFYGTVHWWVFARGEPLSFGYIHSATHDLVTNVLLSTAIAGVAYGYLGLQRARRLEVTAAQLSARLTRAQLEALRNQLNPHFLFNALNSVAVLARRGKTADVERMVTQLAGLLRHSLESSREQLVPLRVELEALNQYLAIEQVRYGDRLVVVIDVPNALLDRVVPSLLLQPLVENAIRYGFVDGSRPLHLEVRAHSDEGQLVLAVADDGPGLPDQKDTNEGRGLGNTRARLAGLYGGAASLTLAAGAGGRGARVSVVLPDPPA